jgi:hypothetical protein
MSAGLSIEAYIWIAGLLALAFLTPGESHFTLCPLANMGFEHCPGCGLGKSITFLFHGNIMESFKAHPLGIFAVGVLVYRIITLIKQSYYKTINQKP